jgi:hypothetical protein
MERIWMNTLNSIDHALKSARAIELNKRNIESGVDLQAANKFC